MNSREFYFEYCNLISSINEKYDNYAKNNGVDSNNLFWILYALNDNKLHTQLDLSLHCALPKTTVNTIVKNLEKEEYVSLKIGNDKREKIIVLTKKGKKYTNAILKELFRKEDKIFNENKKVLSELINNLKTFNMLIGDLGE